jgi:hypothetical protein
MLIERVPDTCYWISSCQKLTAKLLQLDDGQVKFQFPITVFATLTLRSRACRLFTNVFIESSSDCKTLPRIVESWAV